MKVEGQCTFFCPKVVVCTLVLAILAFAAGPALQLAISDAKQTELNTDPDPQNIFASLPQDSTPRFQVKKLRISGNSLLTDTQLLSDMPLIFDAVSAITPDKDAEPLYDFRNVKALIDQPGDPVEISARTIQGLTQYLLSIYRKNGYAGIYVFVPKEAFDDNNQIHDGILPIKIIEAKLSNVTVNSFNVNTEPTEKSILNSSALIDWSPAKQGNFVNDKKLDDYVNLLNRNPDRYVTATVSKGSEPNSIALAYNIYEADPWHFFAQIDNSGTKDRQWTPRIGIINTNLLGFDDIATLVYQAKPNNKIDDEYSIYGSYDFPVMGPRLRLNLFAGHNEFDIDGNDNISFLGKGTFYGGTLRYNLLQSDGWFLDITGSLSRQKSRVTPSLFPDELESNATINLWGAGFELYRDTDMSNSRLAFQRVQSFGGSDSDNFSMRYAAQTDFSIYTLSAAHSRFLDADKVQLLSSNFRFIIPNGRLHPSQMTAFGGMHTVRGYQESKVVADGGILASIQYEYDLIKHNTKSKSPTENRQKPFVKKLAPLAFIDYARAKTESPTASENSSQDLCSIGIGLKIELTNNLTGVVYYGYPLISTDETQSGNGRINVGLLWRF